MVTSVGQAGYFSILRWRSNVTRDEGRNVAVLVVGTEGCRSAMKAAPLSSISPRLHEQGILDTMLVELQEKFTSQTQSALDLLRSMHGSMHRSLYVTEPQPTALPNIDTVLAALYRAYVAPRTGGSSLLTKGKVLDNVVELFRKQGRVVRRGDTLGDFIFDAVLDPDTAKTPVGVLSFASAAKNWANVEHDAGYFLYALECVQRPGIAVIQPPNLSADKTAYTAHTRVARWLKQADVPTYAPSDLKHQQLALAN